MDVYVDDVWIRLDSNAAMQQSAPCIGESTHSNHHRHIGYQTKSKDFVPGLFVLYEPVIFLIGKKYYHQVP